MGLIDRFFLLAICCAIASSRTAWADSIPAATQPADVAVPAPQAVTPNSVYFVVDASGSMINKMAALKDGLSSTLKKLKPDESFGIIAFQDRSVDELKGGLQPATAENIKAANDFLTRISTTGTTEPMDAIKIAFGHFPGRVCMITDGDFPLGRYETLRRIREMNPKRRVRFDIVIMSDEFSDETEACRLLATYNRGTIQTIKNDSTKDDIKTCARALASAIVSPPPIPEIKDDEPDPSPPPNPMLPDDARTVVYVCDCSDSMKPQLPQLRALLYESAAKLQAGVLFNVVVFRGGASFGFFDEPVVWNKDSAATLHALLSDMHADGKPDPREAIRSAFGAKPDVIVVIGAADLGERYPLADLVNTLNADHKVRINLVVLTDRLSAKPASKKLADLARENHGIYASP